MDRPVPDPLADLRRRQEAAFHAGSEAAVERQHSRGKLTARERVEYLLDPGSFREVELLARARPDGEPGPYTDGVVCGSGRIQGRTVFLFSQDFTVFGGSLGEVFAEKVHKVMDMAADAGVPFIGLNDGAGARIQEGVVSLVGYGGIFRRNAASSGVTPQISAVMGPCAGGAVYSPAMTDFVFMVEDTSYMFITGPDVVRTVTGEDVTLQELGGAITHATRSGVAHFVAPDDRRCLDEVRRLLAYLPQNCDEDPPTAEAVDSPDRRLEGLDDLIPTDTSRPFDVGELLSRLVDGGDLMEYHAQWARNLVCTFARLDGRPVGIVANQPDVLAGALDIDAAEKGARFVRTCDAFNIPLVFLVDVPGFRPGIDQEHGGIIRYGAKLLYALCEATVPQVQVVLRKAYGGASVVMGSRAVGADVCLAWPSAELAVMGPLGAVGILHHRELEQAADPDGLRAELVKAYAAEHLNPYLAAERGFIDEVIDPADTRTALIGALAAIRGKRVAPARRKHGNVPL